MLSKLSLSLLAAALAPAATIYTDQATFQAAIAPGYYLETFPFTLADIPQNKPSGQAFSASGFSYTIGTGDGSDLWKSTGEFLQTFNSNTALVISFTSGNVYAVGGTFFHTDIFETLLFGSSMTITLSDGTVETISPTSGGDYRGFLASTPITSLTISGAGAGLVNSLDDLTVGGSLGEPSPTPEPSSLLLLAGASTLGLWRLRRR